MSLSNLVLIIVFIQFFTPAYTLSEESNSAFILLPYVKHYFVFLLTGFYFLINFIKNKSLTIYKDTIYVLLIYFFAIT